MGGFVIPLREQLPPPVHPIRCSPRVLVLLGAAQEVEGRRAVADGLFDGVGDEDRADAQFLELGIVAAEVVVDGAVEREAVEDGDDAIVARASRTSAACRRRACGGRRRDETAAWPRRRGRRADRGVSSARRGARRAR